MKDQAGLVAVDGILAAGVHGMYRLMVITSETVKAE